MLLAVILCYDAGSYQKDVITTTSVTCRDGRGDNFTKISTFANQTIVNVWYISTSAVDKKLWGSCNCNGKTGYIPMDSTIPYEKKPTPTGQKYFGYDISYYQGVPDQSVFNCLVTQQNFTYTILQARRGPMINKYVVDQYKRVKKSGIRYVDFYIYPTKELDAYNQTRDAIMHLKNNNILQNDSIIWLDVEGADGWFGDFAKNKAFFDQVYKAAADLLGRGRLGWYANKYQWESIMGTNAGGYSDMPLWYPTYNQKPELMDVFKPFAGWTTPLMKQYDGNKVLCGVNLDKNVREVPPGPDMSPITPEPTDSIYNPYGYKVGSYNKAGITTASLNCRTGRGASYAILTTLAKGTTVSVWYIDKAADGNLWGSTSCAGKTGYIHMGYVKPQ